MVKILFIYHDNAGEIGCSTNEWKLSRTKIAQWQENYMDRLNKEYIELLSGEGDASEKFWKLEERIKRDKKHPGVMMNFERKIKNELIFRSKRCIL